MPRLAAVAHLALVADHDGLVALLLSDDFGDHPCAGHDRPTHLQGIAIADQQHAVKLDRRTDLGRQLLHLERVVGLDLVLLAAGLDHCVHRAFPSRPSRVVAGANLDAGPTGEPGTSAVRCGTGQRKTAPQERLSTYYSAYRGSRAPC